MLPLLGIVLFHLALVLLLCALGVRFAGEGRVLNVVDYARVDDPRALHRTVGNRLLLLPPLAVAAGLAAFRDVQAFWIAATGATVLGLLIFVWALHGASRHQRDT